MSTSTSTHKIRQLNDSFRRSLIFGGTVLVTRGVQALSEPDRQALFAAVRRFDSFTADNDPHGEHDFGSIDQFGVRYFWKIDYYDLERLQGSPDAADPTVTHRVLTIMRADEYASASLGDRPMPRSKSLRARSYCFEK